MLHFYLSFTFINNILYSNANSYYPNNTMFYNLLLKAKPNQ